MEADKPVEQQQHELAVLFPAPRSVTIGGHSIRIERCTLKQSGQLWSIGEPLYQRVVADGIDPVDLIDDEPEATAALIIAATGVDREFVDGLDSLDKLSIARAWLEVNAAFFAQRLLPARAGFNRAMMGLLGVGPTRSTTSTSMATSVPPTTPQKPQADTSPPSRVLNDEIGKAA